MNLLIVEPDITEARRLKNAVKWEEYEVEQVRTAYSEERAKTAIEMLKPDVILCSIKITEDKGIRLLQWIREQYSPIEIILMGKKLEESYFRKLLHLGVLDYLEKPWKEEELKEALKLVAYRMQMRKAEEEDKRYGNYWKRNHVLIQELFWKNLCLNRIPGGPEEIEEAAAQANAVLDKDSAYKMILITLRNEDEMRTIWGEDLCQAAIQNLARAVMKKEGQSSKVIVIYTRVVVLLEEDEFEQAEKKCRLLAEKCREELKAEILCYMGGRIFCEEIADSYSGLLAYSKDDVLQEHTVTRVSEYKARMTGEIVLPKEWSEILYSSNPMSLVKKVEEFLVPLAKQGRLSEKNFRIFQQDMLQLFFCYMEKKERKAHELYDNQEIYNLYKIAILSIDGMLRWVEKCTEYITLEIAKGLGKQDERIVHQVQEYIQNNLKNEVTMSQIARITYLNPDYTTRIFKRRTGMTIREYLIKKRMEYAKHLLHSTELSISEIAMETGYDNFSYFIKSFRKYYGVTPKQFRKNMENLKTEK